MNIIKFKNDLSVLFPNISNVCRDCKYSDCKGIINIIDDEIDELVEQGAEILCLNDNIYLLNTFFTDDQGKVDLNYQLESCKLRKCDGTCSIHKNKPIFCMLFPIMIVKYIDGKYYWAIAKRCSYYDYLVSNDKLSNILNKFKNYIEDMSDIIYSKLVDSFLVSREVIDYVYDESEALVFKEI